MIARNLKVGKTTVIRKIFFPALLLSLAIGCSRGESDENLTVEKDTARTQEEEVPGPPVQTEEWGNAPDFTLPKLGGGDFTFSSLRGKVIILDFWATWCPPCQREIPGFVRLYEKYRAQGLEIVGVCLDRNPEAVVTPFAEKMKLNYILVFGNRSVTEKYGGIRGIPTTFIIDRRGNIVKKHVGFASQAVFEKEIKKLLEEVPKK